MGGKQYQPAYRCARAGSHRLCIALKMQLGKTTSPDIVAQQALTALGRKKIIHPGWLAKFMAFSLSTAPRSLRVKIMSAIMGGMTKQLPN